jgi:hypothetical protein
MDLVRIQACLSSIRHDQPNLKVTYELKRENTPYFQLVLNDDADSDESSKDDPDQTKDSEKAPACFRQYLQTIPVPREIFFQSLDENEKLSCFNSRIRVAADERGGFGILDSLNTTQLNLVLPLDKPPQGERELILTLGTWVMTPFFNENKYLPSKLVSTGVCNSCIGPKELFHDTDVLPPFWP